MITSKGLWSLFIAGAVATTACGDSKSSMNPVAPSAVVADGQNLDAGDGVSTGTAKGGKPGKPETPGNGNGNGHGKQPAHSGPGGPQLPANGSPGAPAAPGLKKVEIEGLISAKSGDAITVNGQKVVVPSTCPIRHGSTTFTFADLHIGDRVHVRASKMTSDAGAPGATTLEATDVKLQNPGEVGEGDAPTNLVSVAATDALAAETGGNTGTFTLTRSGDATLLAAPLTVTFTLTGTALNGTDYTNVPLTATFAAGSATATVAVAPLGDATTEGPETVILTLDTTTPYEVGSPALATVTISDTTMPLVSVTAHDSTAAEATLDPGVFRFTRSVVAATALTVNYTISGSATNGADYQLLSGTLTIPAGAAFADVQVIPVADLDLLEGSETVIVTVDDAAAYDLGAPSTATVTMTP
jgi:hypothetical protein